ncbi:hypothetical protein [Hallella multisaccharivorax]|uniref:hypothetical protein n=1 Tax=Hallella multisaccharivorax TaxID=310514 RepID=UPI00362382FA
MKESYNTTTSYKSIEEICSRKALLLKDIQADSKRIDEKWHSLFKSPAALNHSAKPSQRFVSIMNTGAGVLDGLMLVWKLYRKFKR